MTDSEHPQEPGSDHPQSNLLRQVRAALQTSDYPQAISALRQAAEIAQNAGDTGAAGRHMGNLALVYYRMNQPERALSAFTQALRFARADQDRLTESGLLGNIGNILRELGRHEDAIDYLSQALTLAQEAGDGRGRGIWLSNLGLVYDDLHQPQRAVELHMQAVAIARQLRDQRGLATRLANLGNSSVSAGNLRGAVPYFEEAVTLQEQLGDRRELALRLGIIGNLCSELGRSAPTDDEAAEHFRTALMYYERTLAIARELGDALSEAELMRSIGNVLANSARYDEAITWYREAFTMFEILGIPEPLDDLRESIHKATIYRDEAAQSG